MSSWLIRSRLVRWLNDRLLGIDRRRTPPAFARRTFVDQFRDSKLTGIGGGQPVLLWPDTFTNYYEPEIGLVAADLLRRAGCGVALAPNGFVVTGTGASLLVSSVSGVFAVGDVRLGSVKRVGSAIGEGAQVVPALHAFLEARPRS